MVAIGRLRSESTGYRIKKLGPLCFTAYNFKNTELDLCQIWHKSKWLHSKHRAVIYLNQVWKIVAPSSEWHRHFYNFELVIIFLHHFSQPVCIIISLFINYEPQCCVSVALLRKGYAEVVFIQPGGKLDTMWHGAWQRLATRHQGEMWPLQMITAAGRCSLSHSQKHTNLQRENLRFTEPTILFTE